MKKNKKAAISRFAGKNPRGVLFFLAWYVNCLTIGYKLILRGDNNESEKV
ncbi:hypothetical protein DCCM_0816 [Desulfocucumis palustris]|uniref:Uncharacterized protein n=1 Tax=Desulfocucumis palustris TaxID=1898651 RepID=A0A2L2X9B2_9FIRM|nr:hypothetical protein DCCM_0816 [Desulfocucumis palustris]